MYNMRHTAILMDIKALINEVDGALDDIEHYGIDTFLKQCRDADRAIIADIKDMCQNPEEVLGYNICFGTNYKAKDLQKKLINEYALLPHMDYSKNGFVECSRVLQSVSCAKPNLFLELATIDLYELHNELTEMFGRTEGSSID